MHRPDGRRVEGSPDYRFTLANERTFLAWIRTALAILASGVLLDQFASTFAGTTWCCGWP
jgi:putative membrane protein